MLGFISFASHSCLHLGREVLGLSWTSLLNLSRCWAHCLCYGLPSSSSPAWIMVSPGRSVPEKLQMIAWC